MKYLLIITMLFSVSTIAQEAPNYLKDATITVTLKNGKTYTYSANEYAIVKRGSKNLAVIAEGTQVAPAKKESAPRHRHIISGELVRSNRSLDVDNNGNDVTIKNRKELGLGVQYQYNVVDDIYVGGRMDANGGMGLNVGVGF
jgi:hypothetical protein